MIWDIDIGKVLRHGSARFELSVRIESDTPRLVLVGPSGSGKTQALKAIAGIVRPDRGHVRVADRVLFDRSCKVDLPPRTRRLAVVFQDYALFPHLTVRQNIAFARRSGWLNPLRGAIDEVADRWIESFHLQGVASHYPHQLSGGQRQRTALARALVNEPTALLLDEPFAALDKALRRRLRDELRELQAGLRLPMLLISHDDEDAAALGDEIVHLSAGRVAREARLADSAIA